MNIGTLLLAFLDPGIGAGFFSRLLAAGVNLVLIFVGVTLLAGMCQFLKKGELSPKGLFRRGRPDRCWMAALACTAGMIALSVLASLSQAQPAQTAGSYSLAELVLLIVSFLDPLLDISHLAHSPSQEFFGLNLIARALILYLLAAALRLSIKRTGELALRFNLYLRKKLQTPPKLPEEGGESGAQETAGGEKSEKDELQLLLGRIAKILLSGGAGVFALFVLGSDDMRQNITDVLTVIGDMLETITVFSNVTPTSGFLSNTFYTLVSIGMVMVYVTAILLFVIFIDTVLKSWQQIRTWLLHKARTMRRGIGAALLGAVSLAAVIGAGVCLQRHPSLRLSFAGGLTEVLGIAANYAVFILAMIAVLMLLVFAISFLALLASFARQTVGQKRAEWEKGFPDGRYWRLAKAAACVVLAGILLVTAALCYENLRVWLMGIFDPAEDGFSPAQVFWHAAGFAALLEGLLLLVSTAAVLAFLLFWGIVEFFLTTRKTVVRTASRLVEETLTELLHTLLLAPFLLSQVLLVVKAVVKTVLQIFTGYRTESDKNNAIFMAACFASLASLLNTFFGLYQFYGGGDQISGYSDWIRTICTFAIACAAQLAMLVFGMKAGEGLAEWRITRGGRARAKLLRVLAGAALVLGVLAAAGCLWAVCAGVARGGGSPRELVRYIPWALGLAALLLFCRWLWKRLRGRKSEEGAGGTPPLPAEESASQPALPRLGKRRLPFYWYLVVYLLLMVISTGFAYSNLFGYYAHGAKVHERVYAQVRYKADDQLQLDRRVAEAAEEYAQTTRSLSNLFSARAARTIQERDSKLAQLRTQADSEARSGSEYFKRNRRDTFIGETKDLEQLVSNIQFFLTCQYDDIGSDAEIMVEEYAHYWAVNPQPSYQTTCVIIYLDGLPAGGSAAPAGGREIVIGGRIPDVPLTAYPNTPDVHADARGKALPGGRLEDPSSLSYSVEKTRRPILDADKYDILRELFSQYERMENSVYNFEVSPEIDLTPSGANRDRFFNPLTVFANTNLSPLNQISDSERKTISDEFYGALDRNEQLDWIRANIASLYRGGADGSAQGGQPPQDQAVPMPALPSVAEAYLNGGGDDGGTPPEDGESDGNTALPEYEKLSAYIDRALALDRILQSYQTGGSGDAKGPAYEAQRYRNYAMGIARLEFQISYDALLRGHLGMNPVREEINELYTTSTIAVFLLLICLLIDMLAFFSGLLLFKSIYLFGKNAGILQMGYLNYDIALTYLFAPPKDSHSRVLHLAFLYRVLYGDAVACAGPDGGEEPHPEDGEADLGGPAPEGDGSPAEDGADGTSEPVQEDGADGTSESIQEDSADGTSEPAQEDSTDGTSEPAQEDGADGTSGPAQEDAAAGTSALAAEAQAAPAGGGGADAEAAPPQYSAEKEGRELAKEYLRDLAYLHQIISSEDYQKFEKNMRATLRMLGITEFTGGEEQNGGCAALQLWLRNFVEENGVTFDGLFPPKEK